MTSFFLRVFSRQKYFLKTRENVGLPVFGGRISENRECAKLFLKKNWENADFEIIQPITQYFEQDNLPRFIFYMFFWRQKDFLKLLKTQGCLFLVMHKRKSWMRRTIFEKNRENAH